MGDRMRKPTINNEIRSRWLFVVTKRTLQRVFSLIIVNVFKKIHE